MRATTTPWLEALGTLGWPDGDDDWPPKRQPTPKCVNTAILEWRIPEGYRKALRLMKLAERFGFPSGITLIDTPGAFPGLEAEQRGQAEAIARNYVMKWPSLRVPDYLLCHRRRRVRRGTGHWPGRPGLYARTYLVLGYLTGKLLYHPLAFLGFQGKSRRSPEAGWR